MQEVKVFYQGLGSDGKLRAQPVEEQLNLYLLEHPNHAAKCLSVLQGATCRELYVIFDVREQERRQFKDAGIKPTISAEELEEKIQKNSNEHKNGNYKTNRGYIAKKEY